MTYDSSRRLAVATPAALAVAVWIGVVAAAATTGCASGRGYLIPDKETAAQQYLKAVEERSQRQRLITKDLDRKFAPVIAAFRKVVDRFPDDETYTPLALIDIGDVYRKGLRKPGKAMKYYERVFENYPNSDFLQARSMIAMARCRLQMGANAKAQGQFKEIVDVFEGHPDPQIAQIVAEAKQQYDVIRPE